MNNNLFSFATKELSQDAVICWCANWLNFKDHNLYPLAVDLMKLIYPAFDPKVDDDVAIFQQPFKIDILLYLKKSNVAIIVEDKVYSSEHGNQIAVYVDKLLNMSDSERNSMGMGTLTKESIKTVYFKTGFYYDKDKRVIADQYVHGSDFLHVLEPYKEMHPILEYYYEHLDQLIRWYDENGIIGDTSGDTHWDWNIAKNAIAQYNLIRFIFPEQLWDKESELYMVYDGSNQGGRPWTEMTIYDGIKSDGEGYCIFWRVDTDKQSPYISLRFYDWSLKKDDSSSMQIHKDTYEELRAISRAITEEADWDGFSWDVVQYHYTGSSKEATLIRVPLDRKVLSDWEGQKNALKRQLTVFNEKFLEKMQ